MKKFIVLWMISILYSTCLFADSAYPVLAPGYTPLSFDAPDPESYYLPLIDTAADGEVLTTEKKVQKLHHLMGDKIVLLSFIYSSCSDVNGCPLATMVFHKINHRLKNEPILAKQLRLLTLSFNPEYDTPEVMGNYAKNFINDTVDWQFLTTKSEQQLQPILNEYQQSIQKVFDNKGKFTGNFSHILRVYLIDTEKKVRNIYSVSFLHADTLINDIKNLLNEKPLLTPENKMTPVSLFQAGDNKQRYFDKNYKTKSIAIHQRKGQSTDLYKITQKIPLGLPPLPVPKNNPLSTEKIALGRKLFYDRRLSLNETFSCAMCHIPEQGFSHQEMATAVGIEGRSVRRNSPTIYNVGYASLLFHDGRENTLEQQVWGPLLAHNEMGNPSIASVIDKIKLLDDYNGLFEKSFSKKVDMLTLGQAIASYERSLISANSPFDQWHFGQQKNAVNKAVKRGFQLFIGKAGCSACHSIAANFALFTDQKLHNTGIGYQASMKTTKKQHTVQIAPGVFIKVDNQSIAAIAEVKMNDIGRYEITQNPQDRWKYKTPSLRNIALTAPYMHDGSLSNLQEVVQFYNQGGVVNETLDSRIRPLNLDIMERNDLVVFLQALTGDNVNKLVADAYAVSIGDRQEK